VVLLPRASRAQDAARPHGDSADTNATAAVMRDMSRPVGDLHRRMTPVRVPQPGDSARAAALLVAIRERVARYRDVRVAVADGYRPFLRGVRQPVYHYTNRRNALAERFRFDPAAPTSLLYRQDSTGGLVLIGVMYSEAPGATLEELDRRVPLSIARWHQHVNLCLPAPGALARLVERTPRLRPAQPHRHAGSVRRRGRPVRAPVVRLDGPRQRLRRRSRRGLGRPRDARAPPLAPHTNPGVG
jgi:hypothetical protein